MLFLKIVEHLKQCQLLNPERTVATVLQLCQALRADAGGRFVEFDSECVSEPGVYGDILKLFVKAAQYTDDLKAEELSVDQEQDSVCVKISANGHELGASWKQTDDWVDEKFFVLIKECERFLSGSFVEIKIDQIYRAIYVTDITQITVLNQLFDELMLEEL